jgi:cell division protein FtsZ
MINSGVTGVQFICANTDAQALQDVDATILQIGDGLTKGLGAGANPDIGRQAAIEDRERISEALVGADMVFITAGMGGGTGTGAAPIVADIAKDLGILTVAVVTRPFVWEGKKRMTVAEEGLKELKDKVDSLITVPNEKLLEVLGRSANLLTAFGAANDVLLGAVKGIADLMIRPGLINMDFADVKAVMSILMRPGLIIKSAIPFTAPRRTSFAAPNAVSRFADLPKTSRSFSFGTVISESTLSLSSFKPSSATVILFFPSQTKGRVTTATVNIPKSFAISATIGAAPVPVPPPIPAVIKTMSAPTNASEMRSLSSIAACLPISGLAPAPRPLVSPSPICKIVASTSWRACASVFAHIN